MSYSANYHTHTYRCGHASGDALDYARVAYAGGCRVLGISDHAPLPDGRWQDFRMPMTQIDDYESAVRLAGRQFPNLTVLLGMECEYIREFDGFYRDELLGRRGYDYLIGACHLTEINGEWRSSFSELSTPAALSAYAATCIETMSSGCFAFLAHPDIIGCSHREWTADTAACAHDICSASVALGVPLELNGNGLRKPWIETPDGLRAEYPWAPFWQIAAEHGARVVLNSDAHHPHDTLASYDELAAIRDRFGLREADLSALLPDLRSS